MNLLIIGLGPHTRRIQLPYCARKARELGIESVATLDLVAKKRLITEEIKKYPSLKITPYYTDQYIDDSLLDTIIDTHSIDHVILATDPEHHYKYLEFLIKRSMNVLMDKPIVTVGNAASDLLKARKIHSHYNKLARLYASHPQANVCILSQRRYHPGYLSIADDLVENHARTGLMPHYIFLLHSDGQFRFLKELDDMSYHGFNAGYGKVSHSGYHFIDTLYLYLKPFLKSGLIDGFSLRSIVLSPEDYSHQIPNTAVNAIFKSRARPHQASAKGEVDAYTNIQFYKNGHLVCSARIDMLHSGFTDRLNFTPAKGNLYKGNGRIRHEKQIVLQGPIYAAYIDSLQSKQINLKQRKNLSDTGGEHHFDLTKFNHTSNNRQIIEKSGLSDLMEVRELGFSRGHQEEARYKCLDDFFSHARTGTRSSISDLDDHLFSSLIMGKIYESISRDKEVRGRLNLGDGN